ncbi:hypothetical protein BGW80DRAFT_1254117 [Lactifluus volemus]|nr:hypothetical protein BGW80DRAFT_1254117 [Lactifluus volemus]
MPEHDLRKRPLHGWTTPTLEGHTPSGDSTLGPMKQLHKGEFSFVVLARLLEPSTAVLIINLFLKNSKSHEELQDDHHDEVGIVDASACCWGRMREWVLLGGGVAEYKLGCPPSDDRTSAESGRGKGNELKQANENGSNLKDSACADFMMPSLRFVARDGHRATVVLAGCDERFRLHRMSDSTLERKGGVWLHIYATEKTCQSNLLHSMRHERYIVTKEPDGLRGVKDEFIEEGYLELMSTDSGCEDYQACKKQPSESGENKAGRKNPLGQELMTYWSDYHRNRGSGSDSDPDTASWQSRRELAGRLRTVAVALDDAEGTGDPWSPLGK